MRSSRFFLFLGCVFIAAFLWAGGDDAVHFSVPAQFAAVKVPERDSFISGWGRVHRVIALKDAVNAKMDRTHYIKLQNIPLSLQQAVVAVEDNRFYHHHGFDMEGILRAALVNLQTGAYVEGGSTITQQLVKNLFLSHEKTFGRKVEEFILAVDMETRYSKDEILEMYLNTIYFGAGAYGIGTAAETYFHKMPGELNLAECSMLAGLPNGPSLYSPFSDFNAAKQRQSVVLNAMAKYGYIAPAAAQEAKNAPIRLAK